MKIVKLMARLLVVFVATVLVSGCARDVSPFTKQTFLDRANYVPTHTGDENTTLDQQCDGEVVTKWSYNDVGGTGLKSITMTQLRANPDCTIARLPTGAYDVISTQTQFAEGDGTTAIKSGTAIASATMANFGMGLLNAFANPCPGGSCGGGGLTLNNNNDNRPVAGSTSQAITQQEMNFLQQCQATGKC